MRDGAEKIHTRAQMHRLRWGRNRFEDRNIIAGSGCAYAYAGVHTENLAALFHSEIAPPHVHSYCYTFYFRSLTTIFFSLIYLFIYIFFFVVSISTEFGL